MKKTTFASILALVLLLSACGNYQFKPSISYEVSSFTATDHRGETVTRDSLKGEPWLTLFIFTKCTSTCSPMTYNMKLVQDELVKLGVEDYKIVPFSIDPQNDTPEELTKYLDRHEPADASKWHMLTGYDQTFIEQFGLNSFKTLIKKSESSDQVLHMSKFYLVDENGIAVKDYDGYSQTEGGVPYATIAADLKALLDKKQQ
ncbi:MAG: SCO family protein [Solibacillus sp.]